jgi:hypothetical protein
MATMTVRMSDDLRDRAAVFAKGVGITVNALMVVALNDYLALRSNQGRFRVAPTERDVGTESPKLGEARGDGNNPCPERFPGTSRNAPCPCGSGKKYKRCCGQEGHS